MSEYQYYEFLALDRPLDGSQLAELRSQSTRAEISATRFANEYHWGDFKGDPRTMMERYTDAASLLETEDHVIISLFADRDPDDYWEEADGRLAAMVQARSELAAGDLRLLYLGWLLAVQSDDVDDADTEPRVPVGLGNLNGALRAVADFLDIDQDLLAVAAQASPDAQEADRSGLAEWIASLPSEEKDALLARVASGDGIAVQALLARRFRRAHCGSEPAASARTAAQLWKAAGERKAEREKAEEERRREQHQRKPSLQERFDKAALPRLR